MHKLLIISILLAVCVSCAKKEEAAADPETTAPVQADETEATDDKEEAPPAVDEKSVAICTKVFVKQRECTDAFLPALLDARIAADKPAGIAEQAKTEKDKLLETAKEEWAKDSTDEAINKHCTGMASNIPKEQLDAMLKTSDECTTKDTCEAFVECLVPVIAQHLQ